MGGEEQNDEQAPPQTTARRLMRYADLIGLSVVMVGLLLPALLGDGSDGPPKLGVVQLDQSFYKTVLYPEKTHWDQGGPNGPGVSWAVFFHKPYCGACRRIRPIFHALADTTNSSEHIRFGSVDCVKYRAFCQREEIDREPFIRIYQAMPGTIKPSEDNPRKETFVRKGVKDWKGMLVAYEVLSWFKGLQQQGGPLAYRRILWPDDETLAESIAEFKKSSKHVGVKQDPTTSTVSDPTGYLVDIESAVNLGLWDDVFGPASSVLDGKRLETLIHWVETLAHVFPVKATRAKFAKLRQALNSKISWRKHLYEDLMREYDIVEPLPVGTTSEDGTPSKDYKWCRSDLPGEGGYPCGLWLLFHTMMANTDGQRAHLTLRIINEWVVSFYGCVECAINFQQEWEEEDGASQYGHIQSSLWLWRVHNMVRARITDEDDSITPKVQFPKVDQCFQCYTNQTKLSLFGKDEEDRQIAKIMKSNEKHISNRMVTWEPNHWNTEYVFSFLQETFCAASDTFVCQGFIDNAN
jgi:thiol-disulfide isomerase/thioredoxin